jgi:hypothetical protein
MNRMVCWGCAVVASWGGSLLAAEPGVAVIRGQSPVVEAGPVEMGGPIIGSAPGYGEFSKHAKKDFKTAPRFHDNNYGYEGGYYAGPEGYYSHRNSKAYTYGGAEGSCPPEYAGKGPKHGGPKHYTTYDYKWPNNLVYPQYGAPAGFVQYPYYTFRGPTDFFMK